MNRTTNMKTFPNLKDNPTTNNSPIQYQDLKKHDKDLKMYCSYRSIDR